MKKTVIFIFICALLLSSCSFTPADDGGKLKVACLDFPSYDFARGVCGDVADVKLIVPSDADVHSHTLTLSETAALQSCDLLIYGGGENDETVEKAVSASPKSITVLRLIDCVELLDEDEESEEEEHEHEHEYDLHVWTSPLNAIEICNHINELVNELDGANAVEYNKNTAEYQDGLRELDAAFVSLFESVEHKTLIVGDVFPFLYFCERYGLTHTAAFSGCADGDVAPSLHKLAEIKESLDETGLSTVFYTEFSSKLTASCIAAETGCTVTLLTSCHRVERDRFASGVTYINLMYQNLQTLKGALS